MIRPIAKELYTTPQKDAFIKVYDSTRHRSAPGWSALTLAQRLDRFYHSRPRPTWPVLCGVLRLIILGNIIAAHLDLDSIQIFVFGPQIDLYCMPG